MAATTIGNKSIVTRVVTDPLPSGGGSGGVMDAGFIQRNEGNQSQVQNLGESSPASPVTPGPPGGHTAGAAAVAATRAVG